MALCKTINDYEERHNAANAPFQSTGMGHRASIMAFKLFELHRPLAHVTEQIFFLKGNRIDPSFQKAFSIRHCLSYDSFRSFLFVLDRVLVGLDHLLRRDTRTTSTPCIELFKPFFGAFARKYLDFKLRRIIIC